MLAIVSSDLFAVV